MLVLIAATPLGAQTPAPDEAKKDESKPAASAPAVAAAAKLADLAWLEGCWRGAVNKREFREHWLPLRGDLLIGVSHTVLDGKTQDYDYLRLELRADGIWYVTLSPGQTESAFKLSDVATDTDGDMTFTFDNSRDTFPQHIRYRHGSEGWLYAQIDGTVSGAERKVVYPMRRVDCQTGELIRK